MGAARDYYKQVARSVGEVLVAERFDPAEAIDSLVEEEEEL